jgi:transcriptional regulator with PAS, ATPase and Fis domain
MVDDNKFREDLYYRLNVVPIKISPLRERKDDIPLLIEYSIDKFSSQMGKNRFRISNEALDLMMKYDWPGNIRELQNIVERCVILASGQEITEDLLPNEIKSQNNLVGSSIVLPEEGISLEEVEKNLIMQALERTDQNQTNAAKLLGITRHTLIYRMEKYNIITK